MAIGDIAPIEDQGAYTGYLVERAAEIDRSIADLE